MTQDEISQLARDVVASTKEYLASRTGSTSRPEILDMPVPDQEAKRGLFLREREHAGRAYADSLLKKDIAHLTPSERKYLEAATFEAVRLYRRGELE